MSKLLYAVFLTAVSSVAMAETPLPPAVPRAAEVSFVVTPLEASCSATKAPEPSCAAEPTCAATMEVKKEPTCAAEPSCAATKEPSCAAEATCDCDCCHGKAQLAPVTRTLLTAKRTLLHVQGLALSAEQERIEAKARKLVVKTNALACERKTTCVHDCEAQAALSAQAAKLDVEACRLDYRASTYAGRKAIHDCKVKAIEARRAELNCK